MEHQQKSSFTEFPIWAESLENPSKVKDKWVTGIAKSEKEVQAIIDHYCWSLPCDFVRRYPASINQRNETSRILWQMRDIPFTGIPFSIISHEVLVCSFSQSKKKRRNEFTETDTSHIDSCYDTDLIVSNCPANIVVKKMFRFPEFSIDSKATKNDREVILKTLKGEISNETVLYDIVFWLRIPVALLHTHTFQGRNRMLHRSLRFKIREYVAAGVTSPDLMMPLLLTFVREKFKNFNNPPSLQDQAYYPDRNKIRHYIYNITSRGNVKGIYNPENVDDAHPNEVSKKRPNSLTDIVQEFCSDDFEDIPETMDENYYTTFDPIVKLKEEILMKLRHLTQFSQSLNDPEKLQELLNFLKRFQIDDNLPCSSGEDNWFPTSDQDATEVPVIEGIFSTDYCHEQAHPQVIEITESSQVLSDSPNIDS